MKKNNKDNLYSYEKLKNYALWYYFKYYPSIQKLRNKLKEKTDNLNMIKKIFEEISSNFSEEYLIESKIEILKNKGKNRTYIINYLSQKLFDKKIAEKIYEEKFSNESNNGEIYILKKIENQINTKSINSIKFNLIKSGFDKNQIEKIIKNEKITDNYSLINKHIKEFKKMGTTKEKIIQKMLQKGFLYNDIKLHLNIN